MDVHRKAEAMHRVNVGVIGCGQISGIYLQNCTRLFDILDVVAVTDLVPELARARAEEALSSRNHSIHLRFPWKQRLATSLF